MKWKQTLLTPYLNHFDLFMFCAVTSAHAGDLALQPIEFNDTDDEEVTSEETVSIGAVSEASSSGSTGKHAIDQVRKYIDKKVLTSSEFILTFTFNDKVRIRNYFGR